VFIHAAEPFEEFALRSSQASTSEAFQQIEFSLNLKADGNGSISFCIHRASVIRLETIPAATKSRYRRTFSVCVLAVSVATCVFKFPPVNEREITIGRGLESKASNSELDA